MQPDFHSMTLQELKQYVLNHRHDPMALQVFMERIDSPSEGQIYGEVDAKQFSELVEQHRQSKAT